MDAASTFGAYMLETAASVVLAIVLFGFFRAYRRYFLLAWSLSWLAFAVYFGALGGVYYIIEWGESESTLRHVFSSVWLVAAYWQIIFLLGGIYEIATGRRFEWRWMGIALAAATAWGVLLDVSTLELERHLRSLLRIGLQAGATGITFLVAAGVFAWKSKSRHSTGYWLVTATHGGYGLLQLHAVLLYTGVFEPAYASYLNFIDLLGVFLIGLGVAVWLLEEERAHVAAISERLQLAAIEQRELEAQLRQSQKLESLGRLAGGVAHDFNNLLTVVAGHADLICSTTTDQKVAESANHILRAHDRASELSQRLLTFARKRPPKIELVEIHQLLEDQMPLWRRLLGSQVDIDIKAGEDTLFVSGDPGQLEQVFMNLVANARDAMEHGGNLDIIVNRLERTSPIVFKNVVVPPGRWISVQVRDTGTGIKDEVLDSIFEPFFTTKPVGKGTGLGLSTVLGIVQQAKGHVGLDTAEREGTTVHVILPEAVEKESTSSRPIASIENLEGEGTILLVEDEKEILDLTGYMLERFGYRVIKCIAPEAAWKAAEDFHRDIDLLLTDIAMPGLNGVDLAKQIREKYPDILVLFMSGHAQDSDQFASLPAGASLLNKPFGPSDLARKVKDVLANKKNAVK